MIKAEYKPKLRTLHVWVGFYFNHYVGVVIWHTKPGYSEDCGYEWGENIIAGSLGLETFNEVFGLNIKQEDHIKSVPGRSVDDIHELVEMELTGPFDEDGQLPDYHFDE